MSVALIFNVPQHCFLEDLLISQETINQSEITLCVLQPMEEPASASEEEPEPEEIEQEVDDPDDNEDLDGVPLDGAALLKGALNHQTEDDIDGVPSKLTVITML